MHPTVLATQRGQTIERMLKSAALIAESLDLPASFVSGLIPTAKDAQVRDLQRLQGIANLLEAVCERAHLTEADATRVTGETKEDESETEPSAAGVTPVTEPGDLPGPIVGDEDEEAAG